MDFTWNDTTDYARELNNINTRRPQHARKTENEKAVKFLSSINYPESLAKDAFKELRAEGAKREFRRGVCQFMQNPSPQGYDAALGVLSYMYETRERGLTYGGPGASIPACPVENHHFHAEGIRDMDKYLIGFSDSSFGKTPYPFGGGVIMINGSVGSYFSRKCKFLVPDSSAYSPVC